MKNHRVLTNIDQQEINAFHLFLKILGETGNINHAISESGWDTSHGDDPSEDDPVDLKQIPRDQWHNYIGSNVALPASIAHYICINDQPLTIAERSAIGEALESHYNTEPDYCIIDTDEDEFYLENQ